jgi:hypothetical protein
VIFQGYKAFRPDDPWWGPDTGNWWALTVAPYPLIGGFVITVLLYGLWQKINGKQPFKVTDALRVNLNAGRPNIPDDALQPRQRIPLKEKILDFL